MPTTSIGGDLSALTMHPAVEAIEFRSPGRASLLSDGRYACVSDGTYRISTDDGATWSAISDIPARTGPAVDNSGLLVEDRNGRLVLIHRDDPGMVMERTPENLPVPGARLQVWSVCSEDGGLTWNHQQPMITGFCGAMIDGICTTANRLVIPLQELRYNPPRHVTCVFSSDDGGINWQRSEDVDIGGHGIEDGAFEATIAERTDGSLLMLMRTTRDALWQSASTNGGRTWAAAKPTTISASNSPAFLLSMRCGRMALIWNPVSPTDGRHWPRRIKPRYAEQPDSVYREELQLALSSDGGRSWTSPQVIAHQQGARLRYAYMLEQKPGTLRIALRGHWYELPVSEFHQ